MGESIAPRINSNIDILSCFSRVKPWIKPLSADLLDAYRVLLTVVAIACTEETTQILLNSENSLSNISIRT